MFVSETRVTLGSLFIVFNGPFYGQFEASVCINENCSRYGFVLLYCESKETFKDYSQLSQFSE